MLTHLALTCVFLLLAVNTCSDRIPTDQGLAGLFVRVCFCAKRLYYFCVTHNLCSDSVSKSCVDLF